MGRVKELQFSLRERAVFSGGVEEVAERLKGEVTGDREVVAPVPGGGSMTIRVNRDGSLFVYAVDGCTRTKAMQAAGIELDPLKEARNYGRAMEIWGEATSILGTPVERYLRERRGIAIPPPDPDEVLRYHPACPFGRGTAPCMVALVRDALTDQPVAIHRTSFYMAKAERMALGPIKGGVIKLWRRPEGGRLAVGEGIETVLAAACLRFREPVAPAWCTIAAVGLRHLPVVPGVERLVVLADNDLKGEGRRAAEVLRDRYEEAKRHVQVMMPRKPGTDFNDVLRTAIDRGIAGP